MSRGVSFIVGDSRACMFFADLMPIMEHTSNGIRNWEIAYRNPRVGSTARTPPHLCKERVVNASLACLLLSSSFL